MVSHFVPKLALKSKLWVGHVNVVSTWVLGFLVTVQFTKPNHMTDRITKGGLLVASTE